MKRIKSLGRLQKIGLLVMVFIVIGFTVLYAKTIACEGFLYSEEILVPKEENGKTIYSGEIEGQKASFVVEGNKTVTFEYGDKLYGPYTINEDGTAIPENTGLEDVMKGVEIRCGNNIFFRGGVVDYGDYVSLYNEDGSGASLQIYAVTNDGLMVDENGNTIDPIAPSASTIIELVNNPTMKHKGTWVIWFLGVGLCVWSVISVLFADELFRIRLAYTVHDVDKVEPSEWVLAGRQIGWMISSIFAVVIFMKGLNIVL